MINQEIHRLYVLNVPVNISFAFQMKPHGAE